MWQGAFLHADMDEEVYMLLEGKIAELIVKLNPRLYRKYIWENKKEKPMLYVKLKKALYGTLQAALLFWRLLSDSAFVVFPKRVKFSPIVIAVVLKDLSLLFRGISQNDR